MKLRQMKHSLRDQVLAARFVPLFLEAQPREPALAPHASILSVLAVMGDSSAQRWGEREALTRALVREQQRAPGPFWSGVLLLAFVPMLSYLRGRICGDAFGRDDHDQLVVGAFLEAVVCFPMEKRLDRTAMPKVGLSVVRPPHTVDVDALLATADPFTRVALALCVDAGLRAGRCGGSSGSMSISSAAASRCGRQSTSARRTRPSRVTRGRCHSR
jgi:hypothetical protein